MDFINSHTNIDIQALLVWLTLPFYDFCGFRSVAVNYVYKLLFFTFICYSYGADKNRIKNRVAQKKRGLRRDKGS